MNRQEVLDYLEDMYKKLDQDNAEQAALRSIISTVQGAIAGGNLRELMELTYKFSKEQVARLNYRNN